MSIQSAATVPTAKDTGGALPPRPCLTEAETAAYLRKSPRWVRRAKDAGVLPFTRSGRTVLYYVEDLDAYLRSNRVEAVRR